MVRAKPTSKKSAPFGVVGIGASAGGITALQSLFGALTPPPKLAFVVVQHLPEKPSELVALIGRWTRLPVYEAREGVKLKPNAVFVAPPGQALSLKRGVFDHERRAGAGPRAGIDTIDSFFESLAAEFGPQAIAVVLSGTGSDGAAGAVRIKQAGGMVLVQDPTTAMHEGMPRAAIANGAADHILPLQSVARELIASASPGYVRSESASSWADDVTTALDAIIQRIRTNAGVDLAGYKTTPLLWRIQRRMEFRQVPLFRDYEALLHDDPSELEALVRGIHLHVTEFFRDAPVWAVLQRDVIPRLFDEASDAPIRAWTPACATGEEAYSLAMLLAEQAASRHRSHGFQVFATDAAGEVVTRASRGVFEREALRALSGERRQRFFYEADGTSRVRRCLREKMVFALQDLLADPPFSGLDLVTCRNLLIYLEPEATRHVVQMLHASLRPGGYLVLGKGEALSPKQRGFEEVAPNTCIYRKTGPASEGKLPIAKRPQRLRTSSPPHHGLRTTLQATAVSQRRAGCDAERRIEGGRSRELRRALVPQEHSTFPHGPQPGGGRRRSDHVHGDHRSQARGVRLTRQRRAVSRARHRHVGRRVSDEP